MVELAVAFALPLLILSRLSERLGGVYALLLALALPAAYGLVRLWRGRTLSVFAAAGVVSVLLTGGIGLLRLPVQWLAVKEAIVPLALGLLVLTSQLTRWSVPRALFETVLSREPVLAAITARGRRVAYEQRLRRAGYLLAGSFGLSAALNFTLTRLLVHSEPGTAAFNAELGHLFALSYPIIALPSLIVMIAAAVYFMTGVARLVELPLEQIVRQPVSHPPNKGD